ncbi:hypothetical protein LSH36_540g01066 [Paralvinella palmiformis]|uniref:Membrane-associated tyrosine- and threonine-specific cdc2-inhibitory kinase n=1 Tax=Paralvinella palmiformis TaxID=53620 RepID=A0AAD9J753_9ANNE|nr:hypothetical protein LSH36_540g01066 [Paralvinella palmiformis]
MSAATLESMSFHSSYRNGGINSRQQMPTPRPLPEIFQEQQTFSTKKEKSCTPRDNLPPRPPVKSALPFSRIFPHRSVDKAQPVSFKSPPSLATPTIVSSYYNDNIQELYFDQCFEIECKLGAGSFGDVFKVRSKEDGKYYAVKRSRERFRGQSDRKRKLEEVAKHEKLPHHPNCVRFYKAWEEKQHLYIQTELCQTSLNNFADQNHNIPERLIKNYLVDLLMAIKHLHDNDLVHMDIKPENIFISNDICKLGDFGLVIDVSAECADTSEAQEGDPRYLAPELLQGRFAKSADIFSLGITLLELASDLNLPRCGEPWHQLRQGHIPEQLLYNVSGELKRVILSMMEPDPMLRPTVDKLLQQPVIKKIWRQRKREQVVHGTMLFLSSMMQFIWSFFLKLWLTVTYPLQSLVPTQQRTPLKSHVAQHPPDWDHSFSDDEVIADDSISINNSLCAPLNLSSSSDGSQRDDSFVMPCVPVRKAFTTPSYRKRQREKYPCEFPVASYSPSLWHDSSSPCNSSSPSCGRTRLGMTPTSNFHRILLEDLEQEAATRSDAKLNIEPKNLLDAFEGTSTDED